MRGAEEIIIDMIKSDTKWIDLNIYCDEDEIKDIRDYILSNKCNGIIDDDNEYLHIIINYNNTDYIVSYRSIRKCKTITVEEIEVKRI